MILFLFPFIPIFESPQMDFLVKRCAELKKNSPLKNPDWKTIMLFDLPPDVTLKFRPFDSKNDTYGILGYPLFKSVGFFKF